MKRDDDYIREMLFDLEASDEMYLMAHLLISMSDDEKKKHLHAELLCDAGLFERVDKGVYRMTNQGHDYLSVIRSDTVWMKTKQGAAKVGGTSLGILKDIAVAYVKQEASQKLGLDL